MNSKIQLAYLEKNKKTKNRESMHVLAKVIMYCLACYR